MKYWLGIIITISFLGMAVFGIFAMNHGGEHSHGCIAAAAQGLADCPGQSSLFAFLAFHLDTFKSFSTATVSSPLASSLLILLALAFASFLVLFFRKTTPAVWRSQAYQGKRQKSFEFPIRLQLNHWLALHENSPAVLIR